MKQLVFLFCASLFCGAVFADDKNPDVKQPKTVADIINRETGGLIIQTPPNSKKIYLINAQNRVAGDLIELCRAKLQANIKTPIDFASGSFDFSRPEIKGELSFYIIDDEKMPMSLVAPEGRWAFLNVSHLSKGRGSKQQFFDARFKKEFARIGCLIFGGIGSVYKQNLLSFAPDAEYLDRYETDVLPVDGPMRCQRYLSNMGIKPYRQTSYRQACQEGWAPAPTNEFQKAIWDKVHEIPSKPIKIEYNEKRDKGK